MKATRVIAGIAGQSFDSAARKARRSRDGLREKNLGRFERMMRRITSIVFISLLLAVLPVKAGARPAKIKPGIAYYADDYTVKEGIAELGEERNYEEVYKNYEYYEAFYDEQDRIKIFRAYKRGEVVWEERYFYHPDGSAAKKEVMKKGKPRETVPLDNR